MAGVLLRRLLAGVGLCWLMAWLAAPGPLVTEASLAVGTNVLAAIPQTAEPAPVKAVPSDGRVQAEMRNVDLEIESGIVLQIRRLDGELLPTGPGTVPSLDDTHSFVLSLRSAEIATDMASLGTLLNVHVFGYAGSPIRNLTISSEAGQLIQRGVLSHGAGMHFEIRATPVLTPDGMIRLHPTSIKVMGVKAGGLLKSFGMPLERLVGRAPGHGVRVDGDDFILDPTGMMPLPAMRGRLTAIRVEADRLVQTFGPVAPAGEVPAMHLSRTAANYIRFKGGTLRFGRLTMTNAWLEIDDNDPGDPFAFSLARYNDQLVAGYSQTTPEQGLVVHMPDRDKLHPAVASTASIHP
jgi:hypothetical protein